MPEEKRKLKEFELRFIIEKRRMTRKSVTVHIARIIQAGAIMACTGREILDLGISGNWYAYWFYRFMWDHAPICPDCRRVLGSDGPYPPVSNTGVGNQSLGVYDD